MTDPTPGFPVVDPRFEEFRRTGDRRLREELVLDHCELAMRLARRYRGRGETIEDLEQVALLGLLKAVERFDPGRGSSFGAFATPTILGELKRHFRDQAWSVRVARGVQELSLEVNRVVGDLAQDLGRSPTVDEVAARVGRPAEAILEAMEANRAFNAASLDAPARDSSGGDGEASSAPAERLGVDEPGIGAVEHDVTMRALLTLLPDRERQIVELRFYEGMTQSEIGARLGMSQMHVSRLLARSLGVLRGHVETG